HNTLRPRWTSIAKAAGPPLKRLVEGGLITQAERVQLLQNLIPDTEDGQLPNGTERNWSTGFLEDLTQRVMHLAATCGLICQFGEIGHPDFSPVAEQLGDSYKKCVAKILSNPSPPSLNLLLKGTASEPISPDNVLQKLHGFFSERLLLLADPDIHAAAKQFIEDQWDKSLTTLRPLSKLWQELKAGQKLLGRITPDELSDPFHVTFLDQEEIALGDADIDVLVQASDVFKALFEGNLREAVRHKTALDITSKDFHLLCNHLLHGEPLSFDTCATLLVLADKYLVSDLASHCLDWFKTWIEQFKKNQADRIKFLAQLGQIDKSLKTRLGPINEAAWTTMRDEGVSNQLSSTSNQHVFEKMISQIVNSQDPTITWPSSLKLECLTLPALGRLTALEHLELEGSNKTKLPDNINIAGEIGSLPRLKTLEVHGLPLGFDRVDEQTCLARLKELRSLYIDFKNTPEEYQRFCRLEGLNGLEKLTLQLPIRTSNLPDISTMESLHTMRVLGYCVVSECRILSPQTHFSITVNRAQKTMQVEYNGLNGNWMSDIPVNYLVNYLEEFRNAFPDIEQINFRRSDNNAPSFVWKKSDSSF
ncbi:MAG: BTB/POZ domain-containing protein, partial [Parachlamydia sp.]|nr:BTB/POZ domain-containing protein [Parachlamydia sp.]